jgi:FkbM family methyltransferase
MLLDLKKLQAEYDLKIKGVLHIGAHFGQEYQIYDKLSIKNVMFFEPIPITFAKLKENVGDKAILVNKALGNNIGTVEMNVETANQGQSSSILKPDLHLLQYPHIIFHDKINVEMTKLDEFLDFKSKYNMINIDVQGYELEVFKGGKEFLNHIDYVMTEVNRAEVYKGCPMVENIDEYLGIYGFRRVETNWAGQTWGDAFYVKG